MVTVNIIGKLPFTDSLKNYGFQFTVIQKLFFCDSFKIKKKSYFKSF